eukprot:gene3198-3240_t
MNNQDSSPLDRIDVRCTSAKPPRDVDGYEERHQLLIPLADTQIYDMERRGEFSRRFNLTPRYVVWTPTAAWMPPKKRTSPATGGLNRAMNTFSNTSNFFLILFDVFAVNQDLITHRLSGFSETPDIVCQKIGNSRGNRPLG